MMYLQSLDGVPAPGELGAPLLHRRVHIRSADPAEGGGVRAAGGQQLAGQLIAEVAPAAAI